MIYLMRSRMMYCITHFLFYFFNLIPFWISCIGDPEDPEIEEFQVKELGREKPGADIAREVWSAKEQDGTSVFSDVSDQAASKT